MTSSTIGSITFIVASYNDEIDIVKTLRSIIDNARHGDEIIVVDGASTDQSLTRAREVLSGFHKAVIISEPDDGIYDAWNKALKLGSGNWFCFIGCGDLLAPEYRNTMLTYMKPNINLIHTVARFYDSHNNQTIQLSKYGKAFRKEEFVKKMSICHAGALHHRSLFRDSDFSTDFRCISDYHFLLKKLELIQAEFVDRELIMMKIGGISTNSILPIVEQYRMNLELFGSGKVVFVYQAGLSIIKFYISRILRIKFYLHNFFLPNR